MEVYTIGFTKKSAEQFFEKLKQEGIEQVIDIRLNNTSQLSGFAKRDDLAYFLRHLGGIDYVHIPMLAPTKEILDALKKKKGHWDDYESAFLQLMRERRIEKKLDSDLLKRKSVFLCSELKADHCHRRLVVEYLASSWGDINIIHL